MNRKNNENNYPIVYAHRGASGYEYENTEKSFDKAIELGADGLETDCWLISDGEVIIHHDKAIIIEGKDPINLSKLNIEEIKKLILPNGDKILTLREFFEKYADKKSLKGKLLEFSIDLQDLKVGTAIIPILEEFNVIDRTVLCGTTTITLKKVRKKYDSVNIRLVASNLQEQICDERLNSSSKIAQLSLYAFNIQFDNFNVEMKHITEKFNLKLFIWDLHTEDVLHKYLSFKPDAVFSNFPDIAVKIRDEMFNL